MGHLFDCFVDFINKRDLLDKAISPTQKGFEKQFVGDKSQSPNEEGNPQEDAYLAEGSNMVRLKRL
jgi:hypothetical protein